MEGSPAGDEANGVCVFAPTPVLTVTIEDLEGRPDVHLHAGGQGAWVANMLAVLGVEARLCAPLGGETGQVLRNLLGRDGVQLLEVSTMETNACYVEDRRSGEPTCVADMPAGILGRHEMDDLYNQVLAVALRTRLTVLTGPADSGVIDPDIYRRIAADLSAMGVPVVADVTGDALSAALDGGLSVLKVSHDDLVEDGRARSESVEDLRDGLDRLAKAVATMVVITRAHEPALAVVEGEYLTVEAPPLERVDHRGAGDSMTAGIAAALSRGASAREALRLGAAAGAVNVTRHGLASGHTDTIEQVARRVNIRPLELEA